MIMTQVLNFLGVFFLKTKQKKCRWNNFFDHLMRGIENNKHNYDNCHFFPLLPSTNNLSSDSMTELHLNFSNILEKLFKKTAKGLLGDTVTTYLMKYYDIFVLCVLEVFIWVPNLFLFSFAPSPLW